MKGVIKLKKYFKWVLVFGFIIFCIVLGVKYGMEIQYRNELNEIYASRNTELDNYKSNKSLVESYLQVYDIVDENSYQNVKNDMYNKFSSEMQKELFPTVNYSGLSLHSMQTEVIRIIGTNNGENAKNTFLLKYNLTGINYNQDITNLVDVEDGVITRVVRIK